MNQEANTNEKFNPSKYFSFDPDDAGVHYRMSGDIFIAFTTSRLRDDITRSKRKERGEITQLSPTAAGRMRRYLRESVAEYRNMVTLTYPKEYPSDGRLVKEQLRRFLQECYRTIKHQQSEFSAFWFIEFQKRGAPHFHIFTTHFISYGFIRDTWYRIVGSGDINHYKAGVRVESLRKGRKGAMNYASKYAIKQSQKIIPENYRNCGRFWGIKGLKKVMSADITFYKDCLKNEPELRKIKEKIDTKVKQMIQMSLLTIKKRIGGFCLMVINDKQTVFNELMPLFEYASIFVGDDYFQGADIWLANDSECIGYVSTDRTRRINHYLNTGEWTLFPEQQCEFEYSYGS